MRPRATDRAGALVANVGAWTGALDLQRGAFAPADRKSTAQQPAQQPPQVFLADQEFGTGT